MRSSSEVSVSNRTNGSSDNRRNECPRDEKSVRGIHLIFLFFFPSFFLSFSTKNPWILESRPEIPLILAENGTLVCVDPDFNHPFPANRPLSANIPSNGSFQIPIPNATEANCSSCSTGVGDRRGWDSSVPAPSVAKWHGAIFYPSAQRGLFTRASIARD